MADDVSEPASDDEWVVEKTEDSPEEEAFAPLQFEIINYPADITLKGYLDQWRSGQLKIPKFQRDYVWDVKKASKLIESFLLGLPIPGVFLFRPKNSSEFQIIDGQQRIMSVIKFQDEKFDDKSLFKLKGVQAKYEGKRFSDLDPDIRFKFETMVLRATVIQQLSPDDDTSVYQIFERLNTGGVNLNPMEIRQSVSFGPFLDILKDLNAMPEWQEIIGQAKLDKRLRDVELVLRILALTYFRDQYEKPMKNFLNRYMEHKRKNNTDFEAIRSNFTDAVNTIHSQLGPKPFHLRGRLNYGVLDSVFYAAIGHEMTDLKEKYALLVDDGAYIDAVSFNTSDLSEINTRLGKAVEYLR